MARRLSKDESYWYIHKLSGGKEGSPYLPETEKERLLRVIDEFVTVRERCLREIKVQGSRFLAAVFPVTDTALVDSCIAAIRKEYHDATHHCFAYRLGTEETRFRYGDDGEPNGTAGKPILAAIDREGVTNTLVVVTRYFGGVKLGTGGLARAYGKAAQSALAAAPKEVQYLTTIIRATFPHASIGQAMTVFGRFGIKVLETIYDDEVHVRVDVRLSHAEKVKRELIDQTAGKVVFK